MSHSHLTHRVATSLALALTAAAITACGGGSADSQPTNEAATSVSSSASSAESTASAPVTTNQNAVTATTGDTTTTTTTTTTTGTTTGSTTDTVASTDSSSTTTTADAGSTSTTTTTTTATTTTSAPTETIAASDATPQAVSTNTDPTVSKTNSALGVRPAGNTGTGFFVANGKLYDANGKEFRIRGVNRTHYDSFGSPTGIPMSGANTERIALDYTRAGSANWNIISKQMLANKIVPMPGTWLGTCKADPAVLTSIVDTWVAQASTWTQLNSNGLLNIANEWGPSNSTVWRDSYITAIQRLRAAGYTGTLVVDAGGCGQDAKGLLAYGAAVLASDPQKNILFDVHVYGAFYYPGTASWMQDYTKSMAALKATGLPIILGEFGPGRNVGPSPTMIPPEVVVATAEANGWGWMPWSWDDNNLASCTANDNWFSMTTKCGAYTGATTDLTLFGQAMVPLLQKLAVKATTFN